METIDNDNKDNYDPFFKIYHELMKKKVEDILLVSCPYDAFIMEEEGKLAPRIINEYQGLNLSRPPKLSWVSSAKNAFIKLSKKKFDLVIAMPSLDNVDVYEFGKQVKKLYPDLPFFLLVHNTCNIHNYINKKNKGAIDRVYVWGGNADLLLAIIKNLEDQMNVAFDTKNANVRVIIMVEDSPYHFSAFLPVLYKQIVEQTQAVIDESLNDEHRLLKMRGRPKVLVAQNYEEAWTLYKKYKPYLLSVFSDMRFPKRGMPDARAGYDLLTKIKKENPDLPLLALSTEEQLRDMVTNIPAVFINKNSLNLNDRIQKFFIKELGFGDFIFTMPDGKKIARASDLRAIEKLLPDIPDTSVIFHAQNNDFSRWLMARSEIQLSIKLKPYKIKDFPIVNDLRNFLIKTIRERRKGSRQGVVIDFNADQFDSETGFIKIGKGSLGGKARGLAFMASQLEKNISLKEKFPDVEFNIPKTLVITTEGFKSFIAINDLASLLEESAQHQDKTIIQRFLDAKLPDWLEANLKIYLEYAKFPIAVRSSSLFEDAHYQPFAGLYRTYMLPNSESDFNLRFARLIRAIKLVYASTYLQAPKSYAKSTMHRIEDEEMGVVLQQLIGRRHDNYFYPAISGVAQSYNFYPVASLKAKDGISYIALGLGKIVMEGGKTIRFCPKQPQLLPQFSIVNDILKNAQNFFYALKIDSPQEDLIFSDTFNDDPFVEKIDISDAADHPIVQSLSSTYYPQDNKIRDSFSKSGYPVLTFASVLKYDLFPLASILKEITEIGNKWMGTSIEIEFAVNFATDGDKKAEFSLLQIRPMGRYRQNMDVTIKEEDIKEAFCFSTTSLGNGDYEDIKDIIYVDPEKFNAAKTVEIAEEINKLNAIFNDTGKKYILIGPGRWGSSDRWLGIPVSWNNISNVGVMVEATIESIKADPSQGSHFFQNITSLGISYITVLDKGEDFIDYEWLKSQSCENKTEFLRHISFKKSITTLANGKSAQAVIKKVVL
ncbi:MAG: phosphoenolpyruvate synthase PpsA [Desulfobacteraceae bacterium]|nr:phosphoenolpyruvate synthase PpsA [Desulfobacteraceae bacterium]